MKKIIPLKKTRAERLEGAIVWAGQRPKMLEAQFGHPHISLASSSLSSINKNIGVDGVATEGVDAGDGNKSKRKPKTKTFNHGRIRNLPHPKYGPYTCSKCFEVLPTSQKFANHVTSHYKAQIKCPV
ncbi:C2H2-type zinc finger protein [Trifolium pratense]|uniref:C2H2-type zinc finger protein n=1 Tax=Trifolium pratense TaxID=57577 RepID=A0A2K3LG18_TRIPR|nr:C2H2-type zinc finger protein [Trifolium pratense]